MEKTTFRLSPATTGRMVIENLGEILQVHIYSRVARPLLSQETKVVFLEDTARYIAECIRGGEKSFWELNYLMYHLSLITEKEGVINDIEGGVYSFTSDDENEVSMAIFLLQIKTFWYFLNKIIDREL